MKAMFRKFRTLPQITAQFTEAVEDLKNLQQRNVAVCDANSVRIDALSMHNYQLYQENEKAAKFQQNLENLLGDRVDP